MDISEKIAKFFKQYPQQTYDKHELLLQPEEPVNSVFYITKGRISQYDIATNGSEMIVNVFKPEAFFPMSSAINHTPNLYFFEASLATTVYAAPKDDAVRFLHENPEVVFDLLARVYRGVDGVLRRMAHLMGGNAESRLIFELLNSAYRFSEPQPNAAVLVQLNESDLARHSGLARETVNRTLHSLKAAGLLETGRSGILIKDITQLETQLGTNL